MMADNKEQGVCLKFCFLLGKSAAETDLMLQEAFEEETVSKTRIYYWTSRSNPHELNLQPYRWENHKSYIIKALLSKPFL